MYNFVHLSRNIHAKTIMPDLKVAVRSEQKNSAGRCRILVRVSHNGQSRYIPTSYYIEPSMVKRNGTIKETYASASKLNAKLQAIVKGYWDKIYDLGTKIEDLTGQQLKEHLEKKKEDRTDFFVYASAVIRDLMATGHRSLAESYGYTIEHFRNATGRGSLPFSEFKQEQLKQMELYLMTKTDKPNRINSRAVHLRNLRAIINRAIDGGVTGQENYPFRRYKIPQQETAVRNISLESLKKLMQVRDLIPGKGRFVNPLHRTADMFLLSFYLLGINPVDMVRLRRDNLVNGRLDYRRAKTHRLISVKVEPEATEIMERYQGEDLLLNFMEAKPVRKEDRKTDPHADLKRNANKNLRKLAVKLEIQEKITMTSTRYTWATIASGLGITDSVIDRALGHKSPYKLVPVYTRYEISQVDEANRKVIDYLIS